MGNKVSIIVPNYNGGRFLRGCFDSLLAQTHTNLEIIFMDGASKDDSVAIAKEYSAKHQNITCISERDKGQADAINKGLALATGDYLGWLNSDDRLVPNALEKGVKALEADPSCVLAYGSVINTHENGSLLMLFVGKPLKKEDLVYCDFIPQAGVIYRRTPDVALDTSLYWGLDWDLWIQLSQKGNIACLNQVMAYCITEGDYDRKSNIVTMKRTRELLKVTKKYATGFDERILFVYLALFLGYTLSPLRLLNKNYYAYIIRIVSKLHSVLFPRKNGVML